MRDSRLAMFLAGVLWVAGLPMLVFGSLFGAPRAFHSDTWGARLQWLSIPIAGVLIVVICLAAITRLAAGRNNSNGNFVERRWYSRYYVEICAAVAVYWLLAVTAGFLRPIARDPAERIWISSLPIAGVVLILAAIVRWLRRADEYHLQRQLRAIALAAALTALCTWSYGFLESAGLPRLSMFWVWPVMAAGWGAANLAQKIRERRSL